MFFLLRLYLLYFIFLLFLITSQIYEWLFFCFFFSCVDVYLNTVGPLDYYSHFPFRIICLILLTTKIDHGVECRVQCHIHRTLFHGIQLVCWKVFIRSGFTLCYCHLEGFAFSATSRLLLNYIGDREFFIVLLDFLYHVHTLGGHVTEYCHKYIASGECIRLQYQYVILRSAAF
jgi:hypothetical protein